MSAQILLRWPAACGVVLVLALGPAARADDPRGDETATVKQLENRVKALEKKIAELEYKLEKLAKAAPAAKPDANEEEYAKTMAGALLDSLLAGDAPGLRNKMTKNMEQGIDNFWKDGRLHEDEIANWVKNWNAAKKYQSHTIDKVVFAPNKEEIVVTGTLTGKVGDPTKGENNTPFSMTLVRSDKKLLLDAIAAKSK
jgi:hypothetical protein